MSWAKLDDGFWMHPKIAGSPHANAAAGIFARMLSYCGCYLTDGLVPAHVASVIIGNDQEAFDVLSRTLMLTRHDSGTVVVSDYLEHNLSKAQIEADREARKNKAKKAASARWNGHG